MIWSALAFCVSLGLLLSAWRADASSEVAVTVDVPAEVAAGGDVVASVRITEVRGFDACQFDIDYDPSVLEVTGVSAGKIGESVVPIDMWSEVGQGRLRVIGNVPGVAGVDGAGSLAEIHFRVIGSTGDASIIDLSNGLLGDKNAEAIRPVTWRGNTVQTIALASPTATSVPPTFTSRSTSAPPSPTSVSTPVTHEALVNATDTSVSRAELMNVGSTVEPAVTEDTLSSKVEEKSGFGHTPSPETPMAKEVTSSPGVTRTPLASALAREGESAAEGLPALAYGLFLAIMIVAVVWIHGRYRRESDEE